MAFTLLQRVRALLTDWRHYRTLAALVFIFELVLGTAILITARSAWASIGSPLLRTAPRVN